MGLLLAQTDTESTRLRRVRRMPNACWISRAGDCIVRVMRQCDVLPTAALTADGDCVSGDRADDLGCHCSHGKDRVRLDILAPERRLCAPLRDGVRDSTALRVA